MDFNLKLIIVFLYSIFPIIHLIISLLYKLNYCSDDSFLLTYGVFMGIISYPTSKIVFNILHPTSNESGLLAIGIAGTLHFAMLLTAIIIGIKICKKIFQPKDLGVFN